MKRMKRFAKYREEIEANAKKLKLINVQNKKIIDYVKELKRYQVPNLSFQINQLQLLEHQVYQLSTVSDTYQRIKAFNQEFDHQKINQFISEAQVILDKNDFALFQTKHQNFLEQELAKIPEYAMKQNHLQKAKKLKSALEQYKINLDYNLSLLEKTLLRAKDYLKINDNKNEIFAKQKWQQKSTRFKISFYLIFGFSFLIFLAMIGLVISIGIS
ncbi:hypothetical protein MCAV_06920 [[Mycoplasma] cavipharyngis]|uniref:hypothetical protein n=1 Tax=[Mycoplasma] cavipharyngis TaxID=92757 RepID=UPI0037038FD0